MTPETIENIATMLDTAAMTMSAEGFHVQLLITLAVPTDEVLYGVFIAYSAHSVVLACEQAGIPVERLTADVLLGSTRRHGGRAEAAHADG